METRSQGWSDDENVLAARIGVLACTSLDKPVEVGEVGNTGGIGAGGTTELSSGGAGGATELPGYGGAGGGGAEGSCEAQAWVSPQPYTGCVAGLPLVFGVLDPTAAAVADLNGDGQLDVVIANETGISTSDGVRVFLGRGNGAFAAGVYYRRDYPTSLAIADLNRDRKVDLVVVGGTGVSILLGQGDGTFDSPLDYATGSGANSAAVGDWNGDGTPDLAVVNSDSNTVSVLLGQGDGTFAAKVDYATGSEPGSLVTADWDGNGTADLAVANSASNTLTVLFGQGDGSFANGTDYATGSAPSSLATSDLNGDGRPDLVVANSGSGSVSLLLGLGDGSWAVAGENATGERPESVAIGDLNGDGEVDLAVGNSGSGTVSVLDGHGDGNFGPKVDYANTGLTGQGPIALAIGDVTGDGRPDLLVNAHVLPGQATGGLADVVHNYTLAEVVHNYTFAGAGPAAVADLNGDGKVDLALPGAGVVRVLLGQGDGSFVAKGDYPAGHAPGSFEPPDSIAVGDLDGDGKPDLVATDGVSGTVNVLRGIGDGSFGGYSAYPVDDFTVGDFTILPQLVALGDLNRDGNLDIAVATHGVKLNVLFGRGDGSFAPKVDVSSVGNSPVSLALADLNRDGNLDLVVAGYFGGGVVLLGQGDGSFAPPVAYCVFVGDANPVQSMAVGDLNGDGYPDLAVSTHTDLSVLFGRGDGSFAPRVGYDASGWTLAIGDLNADGRADLVGDETLLFGQTDVSSAIGWGWGAATVADLNDDGRPDLVTTTTDRVTVLLNACAGGA